MPVDDFVGKYGGPAFPRSGFESDLHEKGQYDTAPQDGMVLRDYFAAAALKGYLAAHADPEVRLPSQTEIAVWCYDMAEAMLKARKDGN